MLRSPAFRIATWVTLLCLSAAAMPIGRAGDVVARRSLDFYEAVARRLAGEGGRP